MKAAKTFSKYVKGLYLIMFLLDGYEIAAQGLLNNGANIVIANSAYIYIAGGLSTGNFINQDAGAVQGTVSNAGTLDVTGDWTNNSAGHVFDAGTGMVELMGGNNQYINGTTTWFSSLSLGGGVNVRKFLNVNTLVGGNFGPPIGQLALNDVPFILNGYTLEVTNPLTSAISQSGGYIVSETNLGNNPSIIQWDIGATNGIYVFPFGDTLALDHYFPLTLTKSSGTPARISASTRATASSNNQPWQPTVTNMYSGTIPGAGEIPVVIDRWWDISSPSGFNAAASFTYRGIENTTTYAPNGTFAAQNWSGAIWFPPVGAGPGITLAGTAAVTIPDQGMGGTIATPWVLSNITAPLPVELLFFDAILKNNNITITWTTASEINSDYFIVEKSANGYDFLGVTRTEAAGTSTQLINYNAVDTSPYDGLSYYRLKQVDKDGSFKYSQSIAIYNNKQDIFDIVSLYINNAGLLNMAFADNIKENCKLTVYDMLGKELYHENISAVSGVNHRELNIDRLSHGIYYITISNDFKQQTKRIVY